MTDYPLWKIIRQLVCRTTARQPQYTELTWHLPRPQVCHSG